MIFLGIVLCVAIKKRVGKRVFLIPPDKLFVLLMLLNTRQNNEKTTIS